MIRITNLHGLWCGGSWYVPFVFLVTPLSCVPSTTETTTAVPRVMSVFTDRVKVSKFDSLLLIAEY